MRTSLVQRIQRFVQLLIVALVVAVVLVVVQRTGLVARLADNIVGERLPVVLISGHAGSDAGAVCETESTVWLTEAAVNANVAVRVVERLRRTGVEVLVLDEYDARLNGLRARALLSLHADSCIDASGYKAAHRARNASEGDRRLLACIDEYYPQITTLAHHPNTITHDMTEYHAFQRIDLDTPSAILEMGFLGGDRVLLTEETDRVAEAISASLICFLRPPAEAEADAAAPLFNDASTLEQDAEGANRD